MTVECKVHQQGKARSISKSTTMPELLSLPPFRMSKGPSTLSSSICERAAANCFQADASVSRRGRAVSSCEYRQAPAAARLLCTGRVSDDEAEGSSLNSFTACLQPKISFPLWTLLCAKYLKMPVKMLCQNPAAKNKAVDTSRGTAGVIELQT